MALIQVRRGSTAAWAAANPVLADGEPGFALPDGPLKVGNGVDPWLSLPEAEGGGLSEADADARYAPVSQLAANPDQIAVGAITRSATEAVTGFAVAWPDGATGVFAGTESATVPGAVDSYTLTHVLGGVTTTYTQPAFTRNAAGSVTNRPSMTVS
jgi:hypothetical protein